MNSQSSIKDLRDRSKKMSKQLIVDYLPFEITAKQINESIKPTIYDPNKEIKKSWNRISLRQFDRKWKKEII